MSKETLMVPIIVDEMNLMAQFHRINVAGVSWPQFFRAVGKIAKCEVLPQFCCANLHSQEDSLAAEKRQNFFDRLRSRGISVFEGTCIRDEKGRRVEKGVDMHVGLNIYKAALRGHRDVFICTGDSDLLPAVLEAQALGVRVHLILSDAAPAKDLAKTVDSIVPLENIIKVMLQRKAAVRWKNPENPFLNTTLKSKRKVGVLA